VIASKHLHSVTPTIVRGLDGSIVVWNRAAEWNYGWSDSQAIGSVSHELLGTVFPYPLSQINQELLERGFWEGFLIHTLSDGRRVRVKSRWELAAPASSDYPQVIEVNEQFSELTPENAHLPIVSSAWELHLRWLWQHRGWWLGAACITLLALMLLIDHTDDAPPIPLGW
jgi:hypothetical protein